MWSSFLWNMGTYFLELNTAWSDCSADLVESSSLNSVRESLAQCSQEGTLLVGFLYFLFVFCNVFYYQYSAVSPTLLELSKWPICLHWRLLCPPVHHCFNVQNTALMAPLSKSSYAEILICVQHKISAVIACMTCRLNVMVVPVVIFILIG